MVRTQGKTNGSSSSSIEYWIECAVHTIYHTEKQPQMHHIKCRSNFIMVLIAVIKEMCGY